MLIPVVWMMNKMEDDQDGRRGIPIVLMIELLY